MIAFPIHGPAPTQELLPRGVMQKLQKEIDALEGQAEDLRAEASELEELAQEKERALEALKNQPETLSATAIALWMLGLAGRLHFTPFISQRLEYAVEHGDMRVVRGVALWFGISLPLECWPPVPTRERIDRVTSATSGLELWEPTGGARS